MRSLEMLKKKYIINHLGDYNLQELKHFSLFHWFEEETNSGQEALGKVFLQHRRWDSPQLIPHAFMNVLAAHTMGEGCHRKSKYLR